MNKTQGKGLLLWFFIIVAGFVMFVIPQIPFQMGWLGGFQGKNLTIVALLQGLLVIPLLYWGLRRMKLSFRSIGLTKQLWLRDTGIGIGSPLAGQPFSLDGSFQAPEEQSGRISSRLRICSMAHGLTSSGICHSEC